MRHLLFIATLLTILVSCKQAPELESAMPAGEAELNIPSEMKAVLDAHGGLDAWKEVSAMTYELQKGETREVHKLSLIHI